MYYCGQCKARMTKPDLSPVPQGGGAVPGAKLFYDTDNKKCYHKCPHCGHIHFYGMEKINS